MPETPAPGTSTSSNGSDSHAAIAASPPPQWYAGYLTYSGLIITLVGLIASRLGLHVSADQVNGFVSWLAANWDIITAFAGLAAAAYGRLRMEWRTQILPGVMELGSHGGVGNATEKSLWEMSPANPRQAPAGVTPPLQPSNTPILQPPLPAKPAGDRGTALPLFLLMIVAAALMAAGVVELLHVAVEAAQHLHAAHSSIPNTLPDAPGSLQGPEGAMPPDGNVSVLG